MEAIKKQRLQLREQQILDMKNQISDLVSESSGLDSEINDLQSIIASLEVKLQLQDNELEKELKIKEVGILRLQELELKFEKSKDKKLDPKKNEKNQDVATAYIEFYTRTIQNKPMFKNLPEFNEEPEPSSPPTMNDAELDEELEKLGLSDVLKKYS